MFDFFKNFLYNFDTSLCELNKKLFFKKQITNINMNIDKNETIIDIFCKKTN